MKHLAQRLAISVGLAACNDAAIPPEATDSGVPDEGSPDAGTDGTDAGLCTACGACEERVAVGSARHVAGDMRYTDLPPAGGDHDQCWKAFGAYASEVPDERWVHNLEHGGVVFLHNCADCAADAEAMVAFAEGHPMALATPYAALPSRFAVVAWGVRLVSDCFDQSAFEAFYAAHVDHAPESVSSGPPSAICPP
ncbi:MAG: hypothetical protein RL385_819 [Pseudomonadota bacterium]|jgi:hypothetical protein